MFTEDCRDLPELEARRPVEIGADERRLIVAIAARFEIEPTALEQAVRTLAQPPRGRRWA